MKSERTSKGYANQLAYNPTGVFAVVVTDADGKHKLHYVLKDHLGSWTTITDADGTVEQELSFDAWGNLRDPNTWLRNWLNPVYEEPMFDRGYTGHEHMTAFGLINMNGRCYDPVMSSFLSVDAFVQSPDNSQSFNRYAYCMNNPLKYTDPSGWVMQGGMNPGNSFNENWGQNYGEKIYTATEVHQMLWTMGISIGNWMAGNEMQGTGGGVGVGSNYTVDKQGYVNNKGVNGMTYDILYTAEAYESGDYSNGLVVYDLSILAGLTEEREDYRVWIGDATTRSGHYSLTENIDEAFKVYFYMTQNTNVEWSISGFRTDGPNEYVINTTHFQTRVKQITESKIFSEYNMIFTIHNHNLADGTKGASGDRLIGDISNIKELHKKFQNKDIHQWCVINGVMTKFPPHYVYHNESSVLYYYTPTQSSIYIRKINTYQDLYRNLGF